VALPHYLTFAVQRSTIAVRCISSHISFDFSSKCWNWNCNTWTSHLVETSHGIFSYIMLHFYSRGLGGVLEMWKDGFEYLAPFLNSTSTRAALHVDPYAPGWVSCRSSIRTLLAPVCFIPYLLIRSLSLFLPLTVSSCWNSLCAELCDLGIVSELIGVKVVCVHLGGNEADDNIILLLGY
jgi:hypothetical protein